MVSAGLIAPLLGETGAHTRDSLVRVAVGIGDVEVWQRAFDFLTFTSTGAICRDVAKTGARRTRLAVRTRE